MEPTRLQTLAVARFECLGDQCPDTCCKGWGMQLTAETVQKFERAAPELLDAVDSGEAEFIMKRDAATDYCVKFDAGWCGIHRDYGAEFLGDACHFYPRVTRALHSTVVTAIALSCPEAARLCLIEGEAFAMTEREALRQPFSLKNYLEEGASADAALATHQRFLHEAAHPDFSAERNLMRISTVARALEHMQPAQYDDASRFYFTLADGRLPAPEANVHDLIHVVQALTGLVTASKATNRPALMAMIARMQAAVGITIDIEGTMQVLPDAAARTVKMMHRWREVGPAMQPVLVRYVQAQLSQALFPYAGLGAGLVERFTVIAVRAATFKLALMAQAVQTAAAPTQEEVVQIAYVLSRFMDHLADATLSMRIYQETGWVREARLRALLGDG